MKAQIINNPTYWKAQTFNVSNSFQNFTIPSGVTSLKVECVASRGYNQSSSYKGGKGGRVQCTLSVTPLQTLYIMVGDINTNRGSASYNASDIRTNNDGVTDSTSLNSRLIVAGGGGNAGNNASGGAGGGLTGGTGGNGSETGTAKGGKQTDGGAAGSANAFATNGGKGKFGLGGNGGGIGGAGGAGWYGGGGGSQHSYYGQTGGGGGGGSSYTDENLCINVVHTQGFQDGAGYITITYESDASDYTYIVDNLTAKVYEKDNVYKAFK